LTLALNSYGPRGSLLHHTEIYGMARTKHSLNFSNSESPVGIDNRDMAVGKSRVVWMVSSTDLPMPRWSTEHCDHEPNRPARISAVH